ncbi:2'-5' RNA ligase family protein [Dokdonella sp.]|uniref:2'-5' RNA ligase family protein n=1 Tax=Dokdonella sp. TaxID=2291710 RepID=UPI00378309F0
MPRSALVILVPEAEPMVAALRERFDPSAKVGVPAHVTVLFPFVPPEQWSDAVMAAVADAIRGVDVFDFRLSKVGRFPATAYLVPEPAAPFVALTQRVVERFPSHAPYGGAHAEIIPHLTVADRDAANAVVAAAALDARLQTDGAIASTCRRVTLLEHSSGVWREVRAFDLAPGDVGVG